MDRFFDGAFLTFGLEVIAFAEQDQEDRLDPLIYVFPRMTKVIIGSEIGFPTKYFSYRYNGIKRPDLLV